MTPGNHGLPYGANSSRPMRLEDENAMHGYVELACFLADVRRPGGIRNLIYSGDRNRLEEIISIVKKTGKQENYELRILKPSGVLGWIRGTLGQITLDDGTIVLQSAYMKRLDTTMELFALVKRTAQEEGFRPVTAKAVGGASDSAYLTNIGIPTVCAMGVIGEHNHTVEEFAVVDTMLERAKLLAAVLVNV